MTKITEEVRSHLVTVLEESADGKVSDEKLDTAMVKYANAKGYGPKHYNELGDKYAQLHKQLDETRKELVKSKMQATRLYGTNNHYKGPMANEEVADACGAFVARYFSGLNNNNKGVEHFTDYLKSNHKDFYEEKLASVGSGETGLLMPEPIQEGLEREVEKYGAARRLVTVKTLTGSKTVAVQTGEPDIWQIGEGNAPSASEFNIGLAKLDPSWWAGLAFVSKFAIDEVNVVNLLDEVLAWLGRGYAIREDRIIFDGDGGEKCFGHLGIGPTQAAKNSPSLIDISGITDYSNITQAHWLDMMAQVEIVGTNDYKGMPKFVCSGQFFIKYMIPQILAGGGVTATEFSEGVKPVFLGTAVEFANVKRKDTQITVGDNQRRFPVHYGVFDEVVEMRTGQVQTTIDPSIKRLDGFDTVLSARKTGLALRNLGTPAKGTDGQAGYVEEQLGYVSSLMAGPKS